MLTQLNCVLSTIIPIIIIIKSSISPTGLSTSSFNDFIWHFGIHIFEVGPTINSFPHCFHIVFCPEAIVSVAVLIFSLGVPTTCAILLFVIAEFHCNLTVFLYALYWK